MKLSNPRLCGKVTFSTTASINQSSAPIRTIREVPELRQYRNDLRRAYLNGNKGSLGFVPTLGALHDGHIALARRAAFENDHVIVSIYLNPTQFGVTEDLGTYPRTWDEDLSKLRSLNDELQASKHAKGKVDVVFAPTTSMMYPTLPPSSDPNGDGSFVTITPIARLLEGAARPVFFRGVATVCMKLFNLVQAERAYFGQKDAQQVALIQRMVKDFHLDTEVRVCPTEREADGLAMSSRNVYLGSRRRKAAMALIRMLRSIEGRYMKEAMRTRGALLDPYARMSGVIQQRAPGVEGQEVKYMIDYVSLTDSETMEEIDVVDPERGATLSSAMLMLPLEGLKDGEDPGEADGYKRTVRLIDNIVLPPLTKIT
ncbi:MAG: hypothetical protein Q9162_004197 [Coniocarpon cinnabarinum]